MPATRSLFTALATIAVLAACGDDGTAPVEADPFPPLSAATWHVHVADGQALPALVAHGTADGALEQTFLDSATLSITADGRWEQRAWFQRFRAGEPVGALPRQDYGAWTASDTGYVFTSDIFGPRFVVREIPGDTLVAALRMETIPGVIVGALVRTPRPSTPVGGWVADAVRGAALPAAIYVFDPIEENGRTISVHLVVDSVRLALHPTGQYRHRTWYTEWEGNPGGSWHTVRHRWTLTDFGLWVRNGTALALDSQWLQNHRMTGTFDPVTGSLAMLHGLSHGDPPVAFRYRR